jgi:NAD(P)-dependent dehydrogenase (short-subunit alcohol dehydrogenase family)
MVFFDTGGSRGIGSGIVLAAARSAELVVFRSTPGAAFIINGQELRVNGGLDWDP